MPSTSSYLDSPLRSPFHSHGTSSSNGLRAHGIRYPSGLYTFAVNGQASCSAFANKYSLQVSDMIAWNQDAVGGAACTSLQNGQQYCVSHTAVVPEAGDPAIPLGNGTMLGCPKYYTTKGNDTCDGIAKEFGMSLADFTHCIPGVRSECQSLWVSAKYCVQMPATEPSKLRRQIAATTPASLPASLPNPSDFAHPYGPGTMTAADDCTKWDVAQPGDTCQTIAARNQETFEAFMECNSDGVGGPSYPTT
jgi:hypothetical protein